MGLLNSAWNAIDPFVPDEQIMGLLGRFRGSHQPSTPTYGNPDPPKAQGGITPPRNLADMAAQSANNIPQSPSIGRYLTGFLDGQLPWDVKAKYENAQRTAHLLRDAGLSPEEMVAFLANPKALGQALASHSSDLVLNQGAVRNRAGTNIAAAPVIGASGDRVRVTDPLSGETDFSQARDPSFAEQTQRQTADQNAVNQERLAQSRAIQAQIAQERVDAQRGHYGNQDAIARQREGRLRSQGGPGGHPGAGVPRGSGSATLDAIAAELKRRGKL